MWRSDTEHPHKHTKRQGNHGARTLRRPNSYPLGTTHQGARERGQGKHTPPRCTRRPTPLPQGLRQAHTPLQGHHKVGGQWQGTRLYTHWEGGQRRERGCEVACELVQAGPECAPPSHAATPHARTHTQYTHTSAHKRAGKRHTPRTLPAPHTEGGTGGGERTREGGRSCFRTPRPRPRPRPLPSRR